jgi:hypothetical protein
LSKTFLAKVDACRDQEAIRYALADLNTFLKGLSAGELLTAVSEAPTSGLTEFAANYTAAMVEQACNRAAVPPPPWTRSVAPLREPYLRRLFELLNEELKAADIEGELSWL